MSLATVDLPSNPDELRAFAQALQAQHAATVTALATSQAELRAAKATIQLTTLEIEKLKVQLARLRRMQFGQSSERLTREIEQLELKLEELEAVEAEATSAAADVGVAPPAREKRKPKRRPLPDHLPRHEVVHAAPHADGCGACGGTMSALGEDVTEVLEYVPGRFQVVRHVQARLPALRRHHPGAGTGAAHPARACRTRPARARPGVQVRRHLPLYRQAEIYAREGVALDRSTMADWVGQVSWLLQPLVEHIRAHVFAADKIHTDDTPVPVLAPGTGKTRTGRLWVYARDDRGWQGTAPPAAAYFYTPDRKGERPRSHLAGFSGFLQADGYAGYEQLYDGRRQPGPIVEVACWAHVRRKIYDVWKATGSTTARAGVRMIDAMYQMEELARGLPLEQRLDRRQVVKVGVNGFFNWAEDAMRGISAKGALADAIRYAVKRRAALTRFCDDAHLEADNNRAEDCLRPMALGRKNYLFAGSDKGGERAAAIYTLIETARLNFVDPQAWLRDVLTRIADGHPAKRIGELASWSWAS